MYTYLSFLASSNKAFHSETLEGIIVGGAFISPLKLIATTGGVHYVELPIDTQHTDINFFDVKQIPHSLQCPQINN